VVAVAVYLTPGVHESSLNSFFTEVQVDQTVLTHHLKAHATEAVFA
jgi:hypothetical protein